MTSESQDQQPTERRHLQRLKVSIPCTVTVLGKEITARIVDMSVEGALITDSTWMPTEDSETALRFRYRKENIHLLGRVSSEVVHTQTADPASFGIKFSSSLETVWEQIGPVVEALISESQSKK